MVKHPENNEKYTVNQQVFGSNLCAILDASEFLSRKIKHSINMNYGTSTEKIEIPFKNQAEISQKLVDFRTKITEFLQEMEQLM